MFESTPVTDEVAETLKERVLKMLQNNQMTARQIQLALIRDEELLPKGINLYHLVRQVIKPLEISGKIAMEEPSKLHRLVLA